jgi:D-alanyl-D-alanine carboxypeptidase (penicillin-binding protein 5/6)
LARGAKWAALIVLALVIASDPPAAARSQRAARGRHAVAASRDIDHHASYRLASLEPASPAAALEEVAAASAVLMDAETGAVLFARNHVELRPPASTTKIMTALLILEEGRLDDTVVVTDRAARTGGAGLGLRRGQRVSVRDLLWGVLLRSANDAAVAAAEHVAGTHDRFVAWMNAKAGSLGMERTNFANPHGLDDRGHFSTAYDLAVLARHALRNPTFAHMVRTREAWLTVRSGRQGRTVRRRLLRSHNRLLGQFAGADGVKTGFTGRAGRCLVASATRGDHQLIAVLLDDADRWSTAATLLEYGFAVVNGAEPSPRVLGGAPSDVQDDEGG